MKMFYRFLAFFAVLSFCTPAFGQATFSNTSGLRAYDSSKDAGITLPMGKQTVVAAQPTVTAGAYATGNDVGGKITLAGAVNAVPASGLLQKVAVKFKSAQTAPFDVVIFDADPTSTTITDKTAFSVAVADFQKVQGVVHVTDCTTLGTVSYCIASGLALPLKPSTGTTLYAAIVTRGTPTFASTSDVSIAFAFIVD